MRTFLLIGGGAIIGAVIVIGLVWYVLESFARDVARKKWDDDL